ncbi:unnamed protein product [Notodromas monacha]|uniref:RING-type domain-containing protein n=1 Tax=Notodromas monacha TaxID=399045 RepID=A0A7R9GEL0_9CRUS|nr:unnamed protein product [Notodromas monacha]CAG0919854.1 unnamed protein product [Notodromas monacha]
MIAVYTNVMVPAIDLFETYVAPLAQRTQMLAAFRLVSRAELAASDVCPICLDALTSLARVTPCNHVFHGNCLFRCLTVTNLCPMCKRPKNCESTLGDKKYALASHYENVPVAQFICSPRNSGKFGRLYFILRNWRVGVVLGGDMMRKSIVFIEETPDVFYCPQDKPTTIDTMFVKARPLDKLCEFHGKRLPRKYRSDCYNDVDESEFACLEKERITKRMTSFNETGELTNAVRR